MKRNKFRQLYGIVAIYAIPLIKRNPIWMITSLIIPFSFVVMFYFVGGKNLSVQAPVGALTILSFNAGLVNLPQYLVMSKFRKFHYYFISAPISAILYNLGIAIAMLIPTIPGLIIMLLLCYILRAKFSILGIGALILTILLTWAIGSLFGFLIGMSFNSPMYISAIANTAGLLLGTLPPVYYPLNYVSFAWRNVLLIIPTVSSAHLMRWALGTTKVSIAEIVLSCVILLIYVFIFTIVVQRKTQWMES
jgi:hypothetical protein